MYLIGCTKKHGPEEHIHTKVHVLRIEPTCISEGRIEYWYCSQCKRVYKDKDAEYEISWEETKLSKIEHKIVEQEAVLPTCETTGLSSGKYCSYCKQVIEEQTILPATGHNYDISSSTWEWDDFKSARFILSCSNNEEHKDIYEAEITSTTTPATCTDAGKTIYTASVWLDDKSYSDQKEEIILPLGHNFDIEHISWSWKDEESASAQIPCKNDLSHTLICEGTLEVQILPTTCTEAGKRITTATIVIEGQSFKDVKEVEIPALGHAFDYKNIIWSWKDYSFANATVTCANNVEHKATYDAQITSKIDLPTCTKKGKKTYTATITVEGQAYTDEKEEVLESLGHHFNYDDYHWKWNGYEEAILYFSCTHNPSHLDSYTALITTNTIPATCVSEGKVIYTANINFQGKLYTDRKERILPIDPSNHAYDYEHPSWVWTPIVDGYEAKALVFCVCEQSSLEFEVTSITENIQLATFEATGLKEYHAEVLLKEKRFSDTKTEVLPMKQYVHSEEEFLNLIQAEAYDLTLKNDIVLSKETLLEGRYASIDLNGFSLFMSGNPLCFAATHSSIRNGDLVTDFKNSLEGYALVSDKQTNLLIEDITTFGGINIRNATAKIRNADITATISCAVCAQRGSTVVIESGTLRKSFEGNKNNFFWVEPLGKDGEISYSASGLSLTSLIKFYTTVHATLYNDLTSIKPEYESEPVIETISTKEYLLSTLDYKCLSFTEDLTFTKEEFQDEKIILQGKRIAIDLNGFALTVPEGMLTISSEAATICNGSLKASLWDNSGYVISIESGCQALIENVQALGSIKSDNSSIILKDVVISSFLPENK